MDITLTIDIDRTFPRSPLWGDLEGAFLRYRFLQTFTKIVLGLKI